MVEPTELGPRGELGPRKAAVLRAVVEEYVSTGEPVGSETIAERYGLGVSSATIRNELAALEELGYLIHPHTSAGRIPTDLGYRRYVDALPARGRLPDSQRRTIATFFAETMLDLEEVLRGTTQLLSRLTQYAGVAVPPSFAEERLLRVEILEVGHNVLILVIDQHGRVHREVVDRPEGADAAAREAVEHRLESFPGMTLADSQAKALKMAGESRPPERDLLLSVAETLGGMQSGARSMHVVVGGVANLADEAAHWRRETIRRLFEALEAESEMLHLLHDVSPGTDDLAVTIGAEHPTTGEWEASIVTAPFRAGEEALGTIGVVGPTRMDYISVMASVRAVARRLSELATELDK